MSTDTAMISPMQESDKEEVYTLVCSVFDEFVRHDFSDEGIAEFLSASRRMIFEGEDDHSILIARLDGEIAGMIDIKENHHISLLFTRTALMGRGIAGSLLSESIRQIRRTAPHIAEIDVNSSIYAVPIYEHLGFRQTKPEQEINGIRFIEMKKQL